MQLENPAHASTAKADLPVGGPVMGDPELAREPRAGAGYGELDARQTCTPFVYDTSVDMPADGHHSFRRRGFRDTDFGRLPRRDRFSSGRAADHTHTALEPPPDAGRPARLRPGPSRAGSPRGPSTGPSKPPRLRAGRGRSPPLRAASAPDGSIRPGRTAPRSSAAQAEPLDQPPAPGLGSARPHGPAGAARSVDEPRATPRSEASGGRRRPARFGSSATVIQN